MRNTPSRWNLCLERLLAAENLSPNEARLMHVLMRRTLGWNQSSDRVGERRLIELCRFPFRSTLQKARSGLIRKGLIEYEAGVGRGNRSLYRIVLEPWEKRDDLPGSFSAEKRVPSIAEKRALQPAHGRDTQAGKDQNRKVKTPHGGGREEQPHRSWREDRTEEQLAELNGFVRPLIGDAGYPAFLASALSSDHAAEDEVEMMLAGHRFVQLIGAVVPTRARVEAAEGAP